MGIFDGLQNALAPYVGGATIAGLILGLVVIVVLLIVLEWTIGDMGKGKNSGSIFILSGGIGIAFSYGVGWWSDWALIFVAIVLLFIMAAPLGRGKSE